MAKKRQAAQLSIDIFANVARLATDMGKAVNILGDFQKNVASIGRVVKANFAFDILKTVGPKLKTFGGLLASLADQGDAVDDIASSFEALGGSAESLKQAQQATLGMASAFDLMKVANEGLIRGIPEFNKNFGKLTEFAQRFADAHGRDVVEVLNELTSALAKGKSKGLDPFGFSLDKNASKLETQKAVFAQLQQQIDRYPATMDSVANANKAMTTAFDDAVKSIGIGINNSDELTASYRRVADALNEIDWERVGAAIASASSTLGNMAANVLPQVASGFETIALGIDAAFGSSNIAKLVRLQDEIDKTRQALEGVDAAAARNPFQDTPFGKLTGLSVDTNQQKAELQSQLQSLQQQHDSIVNAELESDKQRHAQRLKNQEEYNRRQKEFEDKLAHDRAAADAKSAQTKLKAAKEAFEKETSNLNIKSIQDALDDAISNIDTTAFQSASQQLKDTYKQSIIDAHQEALSSGAVTMDAVQAFAEQSAQFQVDEYSEKFQKAIEDKAQKEKEASERAYEESVKTWEDLMDAAINGFGGSLEDILKQVAVGFAAQIAQAIFGNIGGFDFSPKGIGGSIAQMIIGDSISSGIKDLFGGLGIAELFGSSSAAAAAPYGVATAASGAGVIMSDGSIAAMSGTGAAAAGTASVGSTMAAIAPYAAAAVGAYMIADHFNLGKKWFGLGGPTNPETLARQDFGSKLDELIKQLKTIAFFDKSGKLQVQNAQSFSIDTLGSKYFNDPEWPKKMAGWGKDAQATFMGLGAALKEVFGLTDGVGEQLGFILGEQLSGNVDNARLLVQQLGLSFQEMEDALIKSGRSGQMSWHEVEVALQGVSDAFEPGLKAVGDVKGAMDELINSGGRGVAALKGVKDIAVEAMEAGAKTLEDLRKILLEKGFDPKIVDAFMQALAARGIKTLQALAEASDRTAGGIVADLESNSAAVAQQWKEAADQLKEMRTNLENMPTEIDVHVNFVSTMDQATQDAINNGLMPDPQTGQTSAPNIDTTKHTRSLKTSSSHVGDSARANLSPIHINIDARGAQRGVEADIKNAAASIHARSVRASVAAMNEMQARS